MINTPPKQLEARYPNMHPAMQFLIFSAIFLGVLLAGTLIGMGIVYVLYGFKTFNAISTLDTTAPHFAAALWILQIAGTTLPIFIAPVIFAKWVMNDTPDYLKTNTRFPFILIILVLLIMLISTPLIEYLALINQKMVLPHWLQWMRDSENNAQKIISVMLSMKTVGDVVINVIFVGLLTAIVEEFMFRGVIQTIFIRWTKNIHAAVWITAILFSAFHMEFFGFLPRLLLGVFFGYFVVWSGSIWTSVWAHFINNSAAVVATYLFQSKVIKDNPDDQHLFNNNLYLISLIAAMLLFVIYKIIAAGKKQPALA